MMQNYEIANKAEIDAFILHSVAQNQNTSTIKGNPPPGARYSDGELITRPVNVAWVNDVTGEQIDVIYKAKAGE